MPVLSRFIRRKLLVAAAVGGLLQASCAPASGGTTGPLATTEASSQPTLVSTTAPARPTQVLHPTRTPKATSTALKGMNVSGYLAVDGHGNIFSGSDTHTIVKISPSGKLLDYWDGLESTAYRPDYAGGIAIDDRGYVYVVDLDASRVVALSHDLQRVLGQWAAYESGSRFTVTPAAITVDRHHNMYMTDVHSGQIVKVSPAGHMLATWGAPGTFKVPIGIARDKSGHILVADTGNNRIVQLSSKGQILASWTSSRTGTLRAPINVAVDAHGHVYATDSGNKGIIRLSHTGKVQSFWPASSTGTYTSAGIALNQHGDVYVSECPTAQTQSTKCRIRERTATGRLLRTWQSAGLPPTSIATAHVVGGKVDVGGYAISYQCRGEGSPTVVLDAGYGGSSSNWSIVQARASHFTRVCSFDRPGLGGSEPRPNGVPDTSLQVVKELHAVLDGAHIAGPYVLAGHSWGGIDVRLYQNAYPQDVVGMVLVDATNEQLCFDTSLCQFSTTGPIAEKLDRQTSAQEIRAINHGVLKGTLGTIPLVVISSGLLANPCDSSCRSDATYTFNQEKELASASSNNVWVIASWSGHQVERQQPGAVSAAIQQVVEAARAPDHNLNGCSSAFQPLGGTCVPATVVKAR